MMKRNISRPTFGYSSSATVNPYTSNQWNSSEEPQPGQWVHLLELPNPFSFDEALLLCQSSGDRWVAWIPNHGEAVLNTRQFCPTV